ncbi:MAG: LuxR family transcriptional regulator, partial [Eggerthella lenta]
MTALIVGVACLFSTLLIYSGTVISFLRFEHTLLFVGTFAETTLLAATLFGALFLGLSLAGKRLPSMLLGAGGGMLYLCCALAFAYFSWFGSLGTALLIALAVAAALGDVCLALTWGRICARFKIKRALVAVSLASMLSAGICFLYAVLPLPGVTVLFVLSSIAAVIV